MNNPYHTADCCTPSNRLASLPAASAFPATPLAGLGGFGPLFDLSRFFGPSEPRIAVDVLEDDVAYYARLELPGVKRDDISLELTGRQLSVKASRKPDGDSTVLTMSRSFTLPELVNGDAVSAKLENGILTLTVPKAEEVKPRTIEIL